MLHSNTTENRKKLYKTNDNKRKDSFRKLLSQKLLVALTFLCPSLTNTIRKKLESALEKGWNISH